MSTISVTLMPNVNDASSWAWTASYSAGGESLEAPEPNTVSLGALAAIFGMACRFRKSLKPGNRFSGAVKKFCPGSKSRSSSRHPQVSSDAEFNPSLPQRDARRRLLPQPADGGSADRLEAQ
jgi:hypothetical protein